MRTIRECNRLFMFLLNVVSMSYYYNTQKLSPITHDELVILENVKHCGSEIIY
jgi:hypothetical protein